MTKNEFDEDIEKIEDASFETLSELSDNKGDDE